MGTYIIQYRIAKALPQPWDAGFGDKPRYEYPIISEEFPTPAEVESRLKTLKRLDLSPPSGIYRDVFPGNGQDLIQVYFKEPCNSRFGMDETKDAISGYFQQNKRG